MTIDWKRVRAEVGAYSTRVSIKLNQVRSFAETAASVAAKPTPLGVLGLSITALHAASSLMGSRTEGELAKSWHRVPLSGPSTTIVVALMTNVEHVGSWWYYGRFGGQRIGYHSNGNKEARVYAENDPAAVIEEAKRILRSRAGRHSRLVNSCTDVVKCEGPQEISSEVADHIWGRIAPFLSAGKSRSVILVGPPGGGKTTAAKTLAARAVRLLGPEATTLRIIVSDLRDATPSSVDGLLDLLPADVLIVDDLDRFTYVDQLLDLLEHCHGEPGKPRQRLVIATANGVLPAAVRRPRRAGDEIFTVNGVGIGLARRLLDVALCKVTDAQVAQIAGWPAAFVEELGDRIRTIPGCCVEDEIADLEERVRANAA